VDCCPIGNEIILVKINGKLVFDKEKSVSIKGWLKLLINFARHRDLHLYDNAPTFVRSLHEGGYLTIVKGVL
jgi:hypothetical protein